MVVTPVSRPAAPNHMAAEWPFAEHGEPKLPRKICRVFTLPNGVPTSSRPPQQGAIGDVLVASDGSIIAGFVSGSWKQFTPLRGDLRGGRDERLVVLDSTVGNIRDEGTFLYYQAHTADLKGYWRSWTTVEHADKKLALDGQKGAGGRKRMRTLREGDESDNDGDRESGGTMVKRE